MCVEKTSGPDGSVMTNISEYSVERWSRLVWNETDGSSTHLRMACIPRFGTPRAASLSSSPEIEVGQASPLLVRNLYASRQVL
jgi:hypothetical protein